MSYPSLISSRSRSLVHTPLPQELWAPSLISTSRLRPKPSSEPGDLGQVDPAAGTYLGPSQARVSQLTREQEPGWDKGHHLPGRGPESVSSGWRRTSSSTWLQVRAGAGPLGGGGGVLSPVFFPCFDPSGTCRPFLLKVLLSGSEMWTGSSSEPGSGPGSSIGDLYPDITRAPSRLLLTAWDGDDRDGTHTFFFEMGPWKTKEQSLQGTEFRLQFLLLTSLPEAVSINKLPNKEGEPVGGLGQWPDPRTCFLLWGLPQSWGNWMRSWI